MKNLYISLSVMGALLFCSPIIAQPMSADLVEPITVDDADRIEQMSGKTILVFTPHPDDETFAMGGTLKRLVDQGNKVAIVIYTNDNKGSKDLEMTRERLARIRRAEEEASCAALGIDKSAITWLGYEDGDLEYADPQVLRGKIARLIKIYQPDIVFSPDPGTKWVQWHKTDHRMGANITEDAFIAAEWHLYYPQHYLDEGLEGYGVPEVYYYYSQAPNIEVEISEQFDAKIKASAAHVSQFEPATTKYTPSMTDAAYKQLYDAFKSRNSTADGRIVERFRRVLR